MFLISMFQNRYSRQLWYAIAHHHVMKVRSLLNENHKININYDLCGIPILHKAAANNNAAILKAMFDSSYAQDINVNIIMDDPIYGQMTPLDSAKLSNAYDAEKFLKSKGAYSIKFVEPHYVG